MLDNLENIKFWIFIGTLSHQTLSEAENMKVVDNYTPHSIIWQLINTYEHARFTKGGLWWVRSFDFLVHLNSVSDLEKISTCTSSVALILSSKQNFKEVRKYHRILNQPYKQHQSCHATFQNICISTWVKIKYEKQKCWNGFK